MRFLGEESKFNELMDEQSNLIDALLMNAYNKGYNDYNDQLKQLLDQARAAIKQNIPMNRLKGQNLFIDIINEYLDSQKTKTSDPE